MTTTPSATSWIWPRRSLGHDAELSNLTKEPLLERIDASTDFSGSLVALVEPFIHPIESGFDPVESPIDPVESSVDLGEATAHVGEAGACLLVHRR